MHTATTLQCHHTGLPLSRTPTPTHHAVDKTCPPNTSPPHLPTTKRAMLLSAIAASLAPCIATPPSHAGEGNALTAFLRSRQAANGASGVLAPIRGARLRLQDAQSIIESSDSNDITQALGLVRAASCNCYIFDALEVCGVSSWHHSHILRQGDSIETRASLLQQNLNFGDPCTYSIITRNVTNYLPKSQAPLKVMMVSTTVHGCTRSMCIGTHRGRV